MTPADIEKSVKRLLSDAEIAAIIPKQALAELRVGLESSGVADWPLQMAEKTEWVDCDAFLEAFAHALEIHKAEGREKIDMGETTRLARKIARRG
jgi:hypothetical protein